MRSERLNVHRDHRLPGASAIFMLALLTAAPGSAQYAYPPPYPYYGAGYAGYGSDLRVLVKPNNASVFVDGYFAGEVDDFDGVFQRLHLEPGQHEIVVYLPGHRSIRQRLYFSPRSTRKLSGSLESLAPGEPDEGPPVPSNPPQPPDQDRTPPTGGPPPAAGSTPPPERGPGPGRYPSQPSRFGTLSLSVEPSNAEVRIDGERWNSGPSDERLLIQLADGRHTVEVTKSGYRQFATEVQVRAGETFPLSVNLTADR